MLLGYFVLGSLLFFILDFGLNIGLVQDCFPNENPITGEIVPAGSGQSSLSCLIWSIILWPIIIFIVILCLIISKKLK